MMRHITGVVGAMVLGAAPAWAEGTAKVVVELYTSQGCSSCPPADAYFAQLAKDPGVIALALHVDYWDYIGWTDQFASPRFTDRQKAYARAEGHRTIYTPQMIVGGVDRVEGANAAAVAEDVQRHQGLPVTVDLDLTRQGDSVTIRAVPRGALGGPLRVQLVRYHPFETVSIDYGENAGQVVDYHNIVTDWQVLGVWAGDQPLELTAPAPGKDPVVVILQGLAGGDGPGPIAAAAEVK